jgi:hypothetical protein
MTMKKAPSGRRDMKISTWAGAKVNVVQQEKERNKNNPRNNLKKSSQKQFQAS